MIRRILLPALVATALAGPLAAQEKPADARQISDALDACVAITSPNWIDLKKLPSLGWETYAKSTGTRQMKIGGAYAKKGNEALIVIGHDELKTKTCVVLARLASTGEYGATAQRVSEVIGMPTAQEGFTYIWQKADKRIELDPSGDKNAPKARFAVTARKEGVQ